MKPRSLFAWPDYRMQQHSASSVQEHSQRQFRALYGVSSAPSLRRPFRERCPCYHSPQLPEVSFMRHRLAGMTAGVVAAAGLTVLMQFVQPLASQGQATYRAPRTSDGKADFNGIWQALNEANYDLEAHMA